MPNTSTTTVTAGARAIAYLQALSVEIAAQERVVRSECRTSAQGAELMRRHLDCWHIEQAVRQEARQRVLRNRREAEAS